MIKLTEEIRNLKKLKQQGYRRSIPTSLPKLNEAIGGIPKGEPMTIMGFTSGGKSTFTRQIAIIDSIEFAIENNLDFKVIYFALEDSERQFHWQLYAYLCKKYLNIRLGIREFEAQTTEISEDIIKFMEHHKLDEKFNKYLKYVVWVDNIHNPTGIHKYVRQFAFNRGKFYDKDNVVLSQEDISSDGKKYTKYVPNNPKEFITIVVDHIGLVSTESGAETDHLAMSRVYKYLKQYACKFYDYAVIFVQQQDMQSTDLEHIKSDMWMPALSTGSKNKLIAADARIVIGIGDPTPFNIKAFEGYNVPEFGEYLRFIKVLKQTYGGKRDKMTAILLDGKCNHCIQLPSPKDPNITHFKELIKKW